ncbi:hypothetical protein OC842_004182 [Tilletia horrida]|uniref:Major facilitator superfamily (MFS) profile domain-containing protein n=1 Tax=Tilletia horrida TaxID=155126 RepID=A0AAN6GA31_9BASI|nr:hypothetical protein OC842_004182 [Tilletia horrida]
MNSPRRKPVSHDHDGASECSTTASTFNATEPGDEHHDNSAGAPTSPNGNEGTAQGKGKDKDKDKDKQDTGFASGTLDSEDLAREEEQDGENSRKQKKKRVNKKELPLAVNMSEGRKWVILTVIMLVQISMNFNTSAYASGVEGIAEEFRISEQAARVGQSVFLVFYAIGSLLWAPWSEELGRKWVLQLSLFLVNVFQLPVALAPNYASVVVGRFFGGLFSAGGSVTLGTMADLYEAEDQGPAVIAIVFASVLGAALGPIPCNALAQYAGWRWTIWIQLILGGVTQLAHLVLVPETRETILIGREIERRKKAGESVEGIEKPERMEFTTKNILVTWYRPFEMFVREPIVFFLSLLSGYSDALIFTALEAFNPVYKQYGFTQAQIGAAYVPIIIGYMIAALSFFIPYYRFKRMLREGKTVTPEFRLWWLLFLAPFLGIGLFGFAWTTLPQVPWIASMVFTALIGLANYSIYLACIDYTVAAYGPYSSSATAGNAFARDGLAGAATMYATPLYEKLGLQWASTLLAFVAMTVIVPVYVFYVYGRRIRLASPFAQELAKKEEDDGDEEQKAVGHRFRA